MSELLSISEVLMVTGLLSSPGPVDLGPISPRLRFHYLVDPPGGFSLAFIFGLRPVQPIKLV